MGQNTKLKIRLKEVKWQCGNKAGAIQKLRPHWGRRLRLPSQFRKDTIRSRNTDTALFSGTACEVVINWSQVKICIPFTGLENWICQCRRELVLNLWGFTVAMQPEAFSAWEPERLTIVWNFLRFSSYWELQSFVVVVVVFPGELLCF